MNSIERMNKEAIKHKQDKVSKLNKGGNMTREEFNSKMDMAKASDATLEVKEAYIKKLEAEYSGSNDKLRDQAILADIEAGAADIDDIKQQ